MNYAPFPFFSALLPHLRFFIVGSGCHTVSTAHNYVWSPFNEAQIILSISTACS